MGRCLNTATKLIHGGCFVAGTLVTLSETPEEKSLDAILWGDDAWQTELGGDRAQSVAVAKRILTPIEQVPLGARVPTKNPKPWEFDDSLPEPVQDEWLKLSITVERTDGGVVEAELLRPRAWVKANSIQAGQLLPLNIAELQVAGFAHVTAIEPCPLIASGDGSVITGRFVTRQVDTIARVEILGADGSIEVLEGTTIHPIWSLDRNDWVEVGELQQGEQLLGQAGPATVLSVTILNLPTAVYNIEVHGEHVYEVGELGVLVHNACEGIYVFITTTGKTYVGQSVDVARRLAEHVRSGRLASAASATIIQITGGKTSREIAEQMLINSLGGLPSTFLANSVNPIGISRAAEILLKTGIKLR